MFGGLENPNTLAVASLQNSVSILFYASKASEINSPLARVKCVKYTLYFL